jgi:hypothetical protein
MSEDMAWSAFGQRLRDRGGSLAVQFGYDVDLLYPQQLIFKSLHLLVLSSVDPTCTRSSKSAVQKYKGSLSVHYIADLHLSNSLKDTVQFTMCNQYN